MIHRKLEKKMKNISLRLLKRKKRYTINLSVMKWARVGVKSHRHLLIHHIT